MRLAGIGILAFIPAALPTAGCEKREVPEIAAAAEACGASYEEVEQVFVRVNTGRSNAVATYRVGHCEVSKGVSGRIVARSVKDPH